MDVLEKEQAKSRKRLFFLKSFRTWLRGQSESGLTINADLIEEIFGTKIDISNTKFGMDKLCLNKEDSLAFLDAWIEELQTHWACEKRAEWTENFRFMGQK